MIGVDVKEFSLEQNYPNPFNPSTTIKYKVSSKQHVVIKVFDLLGKEVATLVNEEKEAGNYSVEFNAKDFSVSKWIIRSGFYVGCHQDVTHKDLEYIS